MRDESSGLLEARVWIMEADKQVLIGERFRRRDGRVAVTWLVDPQTILGVMWVESIYDANQGSEQQAERLPSQT
jgi:hypothetical protein